MMAMDWTALVWKCSAQSSLTFFHSYRSWLEDNCDDVLDFNLEIEIVTLVLFFYSDFVDVDECSINNGGCNADAICHNTEGSFTCSCEPGYSWDGSSCVGRLICQTMTKMTFQGGCRQSIINSKYLRVSFVFSARTSSFWVKREVWRAWETRIHQELGTLRYGTLLGTARL